MILSSQDEVEFLILILEIGLVIITSLVIAKVLGSRGIPKVLGFIMSGIVLQFISMSGFPSHPPDIMVYIITNTSLGFIGYSIGAHLDFRKLKDESWRLIIILLGESLGAFTLVFLAILIFFQDLPLALLLGSIAIATAPASTAEVLGEYKARGPLSQIILFIIAFDDILAILFFNIALNISTLSFMADSTFNFIDILLDVSFEFLGSIILGVSLALIIRLTPSFEEMRSSASESAEYVFPSILICISIAGLLHFSIILSCIVFGLVLSNLAPCECENNQLCILGVERLSGPLIALFFILVGFEMNFSLIFQSTIVIILLYFFSRALGKMIGSFSTAKIANISDTVTNYLPISLLTQAGVALGLAALAYSQLLSLNIPEATKTAEILLDVLAVSVLLAEIVGPILVKIAITRAGEVNTS